MNAQQQSQLDDAQKKLSIFRKHLDLLARCTGESKNVDPSDVLSAVAELQSLVEWAAQQPELGEESAVLLVKLQELHQIRENLEKTSAETNDNSDIEQNDVEEATIPEMSESYSKDFESISDIMSTNFCDNNGENNIEDDSISIDKDSLGDYSASTEEPNVANAESPESIEDTNVDIIPSDDKTDEDTNLKQKDEPQAKNESEDTNLKQKDEPHAKNESEDTCTKTNNVACTEEQKITAENETDARESLPIVPETRPSDIYRGEVIIIETDEDNKSTEWIDDSKNTTDPLDVCMYAIRNLYDSLRVKEHELLKLSAMQNDQKHIEALQAVIIEFHKDITNLNSELEKSKKENTILKEQVLELEEAENDARSEAQKLEQKLVFLQEKDSHSQAELSQLKQSLKRNIEALAEKIVQEKELRSQIKYTETLVQKYEDQIKVMELQEISKKESSKKSIEQEKNDIISNKKGETCTKGTQTYEPRQIKINSIGELSVNGDNLETNLNIEEGLQESEKTVNHKVEDDDFPICLVPSASSDETILSKENDGSQKELLKRLHKLIDEDMSLQQQIHYVDEINLVMWKKLQNLDSHIGECKLQNINETNPAVVEAVRKQSACESSETDNPAISSVNTSENIPEEKISCLDQNEQYIHERLMKLEEVNASFEKELKTRENLFKEREKKCEEWMETEKRIIDDLQKLAEEKDWITDQIVKLEREKETKERILHQIEAEINALKEKNQTQIAQINEVEAAITDPLNLKVNQMLTKEKEILKMITNLKTEKNRSQGKNELERLKCNYIELQLELSQARDEIRKIEEGFKLRTDEFKRKNLLEETHRTSDLDRLHNENIRNDKMINNLQMKLKDVLNALEKQESYLHETRESYKKNLEETNEEDRSVETVLKSQLQQIEEGTAIATTALMEERMKAEKELQENVEDLRAKEDVYKAKIADLESDVTHLHEELHKLEAENEAKKEAAKIEAVIVEKVPEERAEMPCSETETPINMTQIAPESEPEGNSSSSQEKEIEQSTVVVKGERKSSLVVKEIAVEKDETEDNVDELRAQVRELQSDLEKISKEAVEMPPVQALKPISTSSLKMQKVEDIDYAEVEDCCFDAYKKNMLNKPIPKDSPSIKDGYSNKYSSGYKDNLQNKKTSVKKPVEDNDYDEVLPRPTNFHVVQQVGPDTLLIGWKYVNPSVLDGFEVYLGDQVHERIYIPDRTKALISGLNLKKPIRLSICALSRYGQMSEPAVLEIPSSSELNTQYFEDEDDEYREFDDPMNRNQRPYSMEW